MEAVGASQDVARLAGLELLQGIEEERGQPPGGAPSRGFRPAGRRARPSRWPRSRRTWCPCAVSESACSARRRRASICSGVACCGTITSTCCNWYSVSPPRSLAARAELGLHFRVGHDDRVLHLPLAQPGEDELVSHVLAKPGVADAVALERLAEGGHRQVVVVGDALDRLLDRGVVHAHAGLLGELHLHEVVDHALEDLALQRLGRRHLAAGVAQLPGDEPRALRELVGRDDLVVHDGHDSVDRDDALRRRGRLGVRPRGRGLLGERGGGGEHGEGGGRSQEVAGDLHRGISSDRR